MRILRIRTEQNTPLLMSSIALFIIFGLSLVRYDNMDFSEKLSPSNPDNIIISLKKV